MPRHCSLLRPAVAALLWLGAAATISSPVAAAQDLRAASHDEAAPEALAVELRERLAAGGARVESAGTVLDFWWVRALPAAGSPEGLARAAWEGIQEGTLVGAVRLSTDYRDIRGRTVKPGVYTLRYGIQPSDGDHLGVSSYRDFLLLLPAALDPDAEPIAHDELVRLSARATGGSHPAAWSLDPPVAPDEAAPLAVWPGDEGHQAVVFEVPVHRDGDPDGSLKFALILVGRIEV